jgi:hypothetical protein
LGWTSCIRALSAGRNHGHPRPPGRWWRRFGVNELDFERIRFLDRQIAEGDIGPFADEMRSPARPIPEAPPVI